MSYVRKWEFGPHGDEEDYGEDFEQAVEDVKVGIEEWWRENVRLNGADTLADDWEPHFFEMRTELYKEDGMASELVWPVTRQHKEDLREIGQRVIDEELARLKDAPK